MQWKGQTFPTLFVYQANEMFNLINTWLSAVAYIVLSAFQMTVTDATRQDQCGPFTWKIIEGDQMSFACTTQIGVFSWWDIWNRYRSYWIPYLNRASCYGFIEINGTIYVVIYAWKTCCTLDFENIRFHEHVYVYWHISCTNQIIGLVKWFYIHVQ